MPTDSVLERLRALRCHGCETVPVEGCLWCVHVRNKVAAALRVVAEALGGSVARQDLLNWADALEKGEGDG